MVVKGSDTAVGAFIKKKTGNTTAVKKESCKEAGCSREAVIKGYCAAHHTKSKESGSFRFSLVSVQPLAVIR
jgi:hypothetical protein